MFQRYTIRLLLRITIFVGALALFFIDSGLLAFDDFISTDMLLPVHVIWLYLLVEMSLRFIPLKRESRGCIKQFERFYRPAEGCGDPAAAVRRENRGAIKVAVVWIVWNSIFWALYFCEIVDRSFMLLLALFYLVCDMLCILYYCPFQRLLMKNRCCVTCRIFNWDMLMICTPLLVIPSFFTWSLSLVALTLLVRWEITYRRHSKRFFEATNRLLRCRGCTENLCKVKGKLTKEVTR